MPWKVPLFSETGELEWFDATEARAKLTPDRKGDAEDLRREKVAEAGSEYEAMASAAGEWKGYF